jgi:hypothetical protein
VKEDLDEVANSIEASIEAMFLPPLRLRMNDGLDFSTPNLSNEVIGVVPGVPDERITASIVEQFDRFDHFVPLAGGNCHVQRSRLRVDDRVQLGRKTSARAA